MANVSAPGPGRTQGPDTARIAGAESPSKAANALRCAAVVDAVLGGYYGGRADAFWARAPQVSAATFSATIQPP